MMASEEFLFDSEELDSQNKENVTLHDNNITQLSNAKSTDTPLLDSTNENSIADKIGEKSPNPKMSDGNVKVNETNNTTPESQNSQEILDSIGKQFPNSEQIQDSVESESSQEILDNIGKPKPIKTIEEPIPNTEDTMNTDSTEIEVPSSETHEPMEVSEEIADEEDLDGVEDTPMEKDSESIPKEASSSKSPAAKNCSLPLSRVKLIMKTDPNVKVVSAEATILAALAAEQFIKFIIQETVRITHAHKKKTLLKQHFDEAIQGLEVTEFLEGMMEDE